MRIKLRKQLTDFTGHIGKSAKLGPAMTGSRTFNNIPSKKLLNRAALPAESNIRAPPSDCNGGIDEPTPRTDSFNVLHIFLVEEAEVSFSLHFALYLARAFV